MHQEIVDDKKCIVHHDGGPEKDAYAKGNGSHEQLHGIIFHRIGSMPQNIPLLATKEPKKSGEKIQFCLVKLSKTDRQKGHVNDFQSPGIDQKSQEKCPSSQCRYRS